MPKEKSPLLALQKEGDTLKKEIDAFMEECGLVLDDSTLKDRNSRIKKLFKRCGDYRKKCKALEKKLNGLKKGKEPTPIPNFDEVKDREVERMHALEVRLEKVGSTLEPDEVEESYFREVTEEGSNRKQADTTQVEEFEDDDDDDDDEDVEGEDVDEEDGMGEEEEGDDSKLEDASPEKDDEKEAKQSGEAEAGKSKFSRMGIFRRSKPGPIPKEDEGGKKDKVKEKSDKEKEKERKEQEKKEKKEKEKLEKERKDKEKKEQKEREKEEKKKKKEVTKDVNKETEEGEKRAESPGKRGFGAKLFNRDSKKPKMDNKKNAKGDDDDEEEEEDIDEEEEEEEEVAEEEAAEDEDDEEEDMEEEEEHDEEEEEEDEEEDAEVEEKKETAASKPDKKKGWSLFRRDKSPQRQIQKENAKDSKKKKEEPKKQIQVQEEEDEEEEEEEEYEDEELEEEEDEEDEYESEEEEEQPTRGKPAAKRTVESENEEEEDEEEEYEDEEEEEGEGEESEDEEEEEEELEEGGEIEAESEEESEEEFKPPDDGMDLFEAVCDFDGEEDTDLSFKRGDVLTVLSVREDGWWMAEDEEGTRGLVPSTYLKLKKEHGDYRDVQSPEPDEPATSVSPRSGKELWRGLKKSVNETGVTDVLSAMGAIPSGFRPSTTARHLKSETYTLCNFLKPRFTESRLGFQDLNWSPQENQIRAKVVRLQKLLTLLMVRNVPPCGIGIDIKSRHVRVCFFDGDKILSNIHTIQATWNKNDPKTWRFSPKVTGMLPSVLDGDCFIRSSHTGERIGLLFEMCLSYVRPKTGEKGELSCGWVHLPLFDTTTGAPIINKMYDLQVNGGTPYEQDVEVDPSISRRSSSSKFRAMMSANKQPRLQIKFLTPTKEQKPLLDVLPETVVSSLSYLPFLCFFRKIQADEILRDRIDLQNADLIHSPLLSNFPEATKYPDIMDALRSCWADKKAKNKKLDKRDQEYMKTLFTSAFMDSVYPVLRLPSLPAFKWGDEERENERWQVISEFLQANKQRSILAAFLAPGGDHPPFDMSEISYNLLDSFQEFT